MGSDTKTVLETWQAAMLARVAMCNLMDRHKYNPATPHGVAVEELMLALSRVDSGPLPGHRTIGLHGARVRIIEDVQGTLQDGVDRLAAFLESRNFSDSRMLEEEDVRTRVEALAAKFVVKMKIEFERSINMDELNKKFEVAVRLVVRAETLNNPLTAIADVGLGHNDSMAETRALVEIEAESASMSREVQHSMARRG